MRMVSKNQTIKKYSCGQMNLRMNMLFVLEGESELLAATKANLRYIVLVDESEYLEDLKYNWSYTLKTWMARQM